MCPSTKTQIFDVINCFMLEMQHYIKNNEIQNLHFKFDSRMTLCDNLEIFSKIENASITDLVCHEFKKTMLNKTGILLFPFNNGLLDSIEEGISDLVYQNPKRLAFIQNWKPLK